MITDSTDPTDCPDLFRDDDNSTGNEPARFFFANDVGKLLAAHLTGVPYQKHRPGSLRAEA
ncbi:MAG: hypothetical protein DMD26_06485 [Gemmatimonadetes bacterium]|nr:MAG: hypothetical protein DMD26_06485 [Gemmatimonadota bacterium]